MSRWYKVKGYEPKKPQQGAVRNNDEYKIIALDIDGTLTNEEKKITPKARKALISAEKRGIRLILASGRPIAGLRELAKELEMDKYHGILIGFNGGTVVDAQSGEILYQRVLDPEYVDKILRHVAQFDVTPMITRDNDLITDDLNGYKVDYEAAMNGMNKVEMKDLIGSIDFPVSKILTAGDPEYLQQHFREMKEPVANDVSSMFTAPFYFEFTPKGINKSTALHGVLTKLGIPSGEMMAFGDAQNDAEMLDMAGMGVAMGNADDALKDIADYITLSNNDDGVAHAVSEWTE